MSSEQFHRLKDLRRERGANKNIVLYGLDTLLPTDTITVDEAAFWGGTDDNDAWNCLGRLENLEWGSPKI